MARCIAGLALATPSLHVLKIKQNRLKETECCLSISLPRAKKIDYYLKVEVYLPTDQRPIHYSTLNLH